MRYCPNANCPYAQKFKRPGEYRETTVTCSDCGATLVDTAPASLLAPAAAVPVMPSDANQRLAVTLVAAFAGWGLSRLPLFGVPASLFGETTSTVHLLAVGMTPFASAFLLVEVMALLLPPLRSVRTGNRTVRAGLDRTAWVLGFLFLFFQLFGVVRFEESSGGALPPAWLMWTQFALAHLALLGLAVLVSRFGLGNGFALVLGVSSLDAVAQGIGVMVNQVRAETITPLVLLAFLAVLGATGWAGGWLGRAGRGRGEALPSAVPFPVSGTGAWVSAGAMLSLPGTLSVWLPGLASAQRAVMSSQALYTGVFGFLAFDLALGLGFLFFRPAAVGALWAKWVPGVDQTGAIASARALLPRALAFSIGVTVGVPFVLLLQGSATGVALGSVAVILVLTFGASLVDVFDEWNALRRLGPLRGVWDVQRTAEVEPIVHLLRTHGIEVHARSFLARATQQFFAPWIPVSILVPEARAAEARALLTK